MPPDIPLAAPALPEEEWPRLLRDISKGQVVPVIGPRLVTVADSETGSEMTLERWVSRRLHRSLGLPGSPDDFPTPHAVACEAILQKQDRVAIYDGIRVLMEKLEHQAPTTVQEPLVKLAGITDFTLYISATFDPLLANALAQQRPEFSLKRNVLRNHYTKPCDLQDPLTDTVLLHLMGDYDTYPDFAIWEEDYIEFMCGMVRESDAMKNFLRYIKNRYLLFLGIPFDDWIVRFFLRLVRQERLSSRGRNGACRRDLIAERPEILSQNMIFYFDKLTGATTTIPGEPGAFVTELARRWKANQERQGGGEHDLPDELPRESIFISYASEDREAALTLARNLRGAGLPVWLDKQRLQLGSNFARNLEHAVKDDCSFFLSLISTTTEGDTGRQRYFHTERDWAASRQVDGFIFYLPLIIDPAVKLPKREPAKCGSALLHIMAAPGGRTEPDLIRRLKSLMEEYRRSGRPKG